MDGLGFYTSRLEYLVQTLWGISFESFRHLEHLSHLKELKIRAASIEELEAVWQCPSIKMDSLCKLSLQWRDNIEVQSLDPISHYRRLTRLTLRGMLLTLSNLPCNLSKLKLYQSRLLEDAIPILGNLPHLRWLHLSDDAYDSAKMIFRGNAFPQLVQLSLESLRNLEKILVVGISRYDLSDFIIEYPDVMLRVSKNHTMPICKVLEEYNAVQ
ncbi:hypothetical protein Ancab_001165 [Ancistrocladus abbreviatus]